MTTVKARTREEAELLRQGASLYKKIQDDIVERHRELDQLKLEHRLAEQEAYRSMGLEGSRMLNFLRKAGLFVDEKKV